MGLDGTYDNDLTSRATTELFNLDFTAISTLRSVTHSPQGTSYLGYFPEENEAHYVTVNPAENLEKSHSTDFDESLTKRLTLLRSRYLQSL